MGRFVCLFMMLIADDDQSKKENALFYLSLFNENTSVRKRDGEGKVVKWCQVF